jgi:hypothetical protein
MKKSIIFLACFAVLGFTKNVKAQMGYGKPEDIEQVKKRKLIVVLEEPNEDVMKKLTKKHKTDQIKEYQTALDAYNTEMKEVIEKFWNFSANAIEYKSAKDVEKIKKSNEYAIIYCSSGSNGVGSKHEALEWWPKGDKVEGDAVTLMAVCLPEKNKPIYYIGMPDAFPTKADLVYGITAIEFYFNYRESHQKISKNEYEEMVEQYQPRLKNRTLLLRQDELDEKLTPEEIKTAYPFAYKTVTTDEMDQYVVNADSNYAYAVIAPSFAGSRVIYIQYVYDCKDGTMLGMSMPSMGAMMFSGYTGGAGHSVFTKKTLPDFCKYITDDKKKKK